MMEPNELQPYGGGICPVHGVPYMPTSFPGGGLPIPAWHCPECTKAKEIDAKVQRSFDRDAVRDAVLTLAKDLLDGHADPANNVEAETAVVRLADLLGNVPTLAAAEGVQSALLHIWTTWMTGEV